MKFVNEIAVAAPVDDLFELLTDVERVAPCLPGAQIEQRDGEDYKGSMKVKVGPITGTYRGTMRFVELDRDRRHAVMTARADETGGNGNAEAWIETDISEHDGRSQVRLTTDLQLRGRVAQFGRGTIERIAQRMFSEFAHNLEQRIADGQGSAQPETQEEPTRPGRRSDSPGPQERSDSPGPQEPAPLDAIDLFGAPLVQKALRVLGPALIGFGYGYLLGRLRELTR